jgi:hypothetical protein
VSKFKRIPAALSRLLTGVPELTPAQQAKLEELEKDYADWMRRKQDGRPARESCNASPHQQSSAEERTV